MESIILLIAVAFVVRLIKTKQDIKADIDIYEPTFDLQGNIKHFRKVKR